ncbi:MAG: protein-glutamate O-methyltransferase CheR [Acidobacteriia bacterium]|nr:protein-glutamate O-methyltransferase CheR [Terriglobia bacterium]
MARGGDSFSHAVRPPGPREFEQIRQLAYRTFGLDLKPGKEELVSARLERLLRGGGFGSYNDYYRHVLADSTGESLMSLIDALTTNHTSFLREPDHFDFLRERVLPALVSRISVEIWSAACSSGEEVWTLLLLLREALPGPAIKVIGTDISRKALDLATRAIYPADRVRNLPPLWISSGFSADTGTPKCYSVRPGLRAQVAFRRLNLIEPFPWSQKFPVIFCRNVMIYFDRPTQQRVIAKLSASLEPGGYLFVGHAESFSGIEHNLEYVQPAVYRRSGGTKGGLWRAS